MKTDIFTLLEDLQDVRNQAAALKYLGTDFKKIQTGYEIVIDDLLELAGLSEKQADLLWEITEPDIL